MFDALMKEAQEIPFTSRMRFLTEISNFGVPPAPQLTLDTAKGLFKVAYVIKMAQGDEEAAALELERQAMIDPQIQQALDYQQMKNERDEAAAQARDMNQQLFEAQSAQAMADQQAQMQGQQVAELQGQLEQETMGRQEAQQQMIASKDQSLQEQMAVQDQKQQMNTAAQMFQEQANALTQQLKGIAAQPTAPPPPPPGGGPGMGGEMPPPGSAGAAQEQQEAANAEQEAAIQGEQAQQASMEDQAKMEQAAAMQGGAPPEGGMPPEGGPPPEMAGGMPPGGEMPKQGSLRDKLTMVDAARRLGRIDRLSAKAQKLIPDLQLPSDKRISELPLHLRAAHGLGRHQEEILGGAGALGAAGLGGAALAHRAAKKREEPVLEEEELPKAAAFNQGIEKIKRAYLEVRHRPTHLDPEVAQREGMARGGLTGAALGGVGAGLMAGSKFGKPGAVLGALGGAALGAVGGGALGGAAAKGEALQNRERYKANLMARKGLQSEAKAQMAHEQQMRQLLPENQMPKAAAANPQVQAAILGAAIGALGGAAGGALPGAMGGRSSIQRADSGTQRALGGVKGFAKGMAVGAASGAAGGALVGATMAGGKPKDQVGRLAAGAGLIMGAPALSALAGAIPQGAMRTKTAADEAMDRILKTAELSEEDQARMALGGREPIRADAVDRRAIEEAAVQGGKRVGTYTGTAGGALGGATLAQFLSPALGKSLGTPGRVAGAAVPIVGGAIGGAALGRHIGGRDSAAIKDVPTEVLQARADQQEALGRDNASMLQIGEAEDRYQKALEGLPMSRSKFQRIMQHRRHG